MKYSLLLPLLFAIFLLQGCGSNYTEPTEEVSAQGIASGTDACVQNYFTQTLKPLVNSCFSCHTQAGLAQDTNFTLLPLTSQNETTNYIRLSNYVKNHPNRLIEKIDTTLSHEGGSGFGSETINALKIFTGYVNNKASCTVVSAPKVRFLQTASVQTISLQDTLSLSAKVLLNRDATTAERAFVTDVDSLDTQLDTYMEDPAFDVWLKKSFNDIFLTDKYLPRTEAIDLLRDYNTSRWYEDINSTLYPNLATYANMGVSNAPLELIAHVVDNNQSFKNILTANYVLVNPFSARTYGVDIAGFSYVNDTNVSLYNPNEYKAVQLTDDKGSVIPHAGLLTDVMILNRFPTSITNVNRHRSYKINKWFLATDILALANRAISAVDQNGEFEHPTLQNPNCAVCHVVMDPIAGAMKNWDEFGRYRINSAKPENYNRRGYTNRNWKNDTDAGPIGLTFQNLMDVNASGHTAAQWLGQNIVNDPRFITASVHLFYQALTGREPLTKPLVGADNYTNKMQAYAFQNGLFKLIGQRYAQDNFNAKTLIKELIKSPIFRAKSVTDGVTNLVFTRSIGISTLLTPEQLDEKIKALTGFYWTDRFNSSSVPNDKGRHYLTSDRAYHILYGGINSDDIVKRVGTLNGIMASIQQRMAAEMGCYATARDFYFDQNSSNRLLFPYVSKYTQPDTTTNVQSIKQNIQYLYKHLWGQDISLDSQAMDQTLQLFYTLQKEGKQRVANRNESGWLYCQVTRDPITMADLNSTQSVRYDENYTIRAWSGLITYFLGDYTFLHNSAK